MSAVSAQPSATVADGRASAGPRTWPPVGGWIVALLAGGLGVAVWNQAAMAWDGSYYLFRVLQDQHPFVVYGRWAVSPLHWAVLAASHLTSNLLILRLLFGAMYAAVPLVAVALCWLALRRRRPELIVWPALGIGVVTLPGRLFAVSEAQLATDLGWPLLLLILTGQGWTAAAGSAVLALVIFYLHPAAAVVFAVAAVAAAVRAVVDPRARTVLAAWAGVLLAAAAVRTRMVQAGYESTGLSLASLRDLAHTALPRSVQLALVLAGIAGLAVLGGRLLAEAPGARWRPGAGAGWLPALQVAPLLAAVALLLRWAGDTHLWRGEEDFRSFAVLVTAPFFVMAAVDALALRRRTPSGPGSAVRPAAPLGEPPPAGAPGVAAEAGGRATIAGPATAALVAALGFAAVLTVQSLQWSRLRASVQSAVDSAASVCVLPEAVAQAGNPLEHWATPALAMDLQRRSLEHVVVSPADCRLLADHAEIRVSFFDLEGARGGWFTFPSPAPPAGP